MKRLLAVLLCCFSVSAFAQTKPAYSVAEITFIDKAGYQSELFPKIKKLLADADASIVVAGGQSQAIIGTHANADSVTIVKFGSYEKAKAFYASESYQEIRRSSEKYVKLNLFIVEGE